MNEPRVRCGADYGHGAAGRVGLRDGPATVRPLPGFPLPGDHGGTLTGLDDQRWRITFTIARHAAGLPVRRYISTITDRPVIVSDHTPVERSSAFDCDEADEDKVITQVRAACCFPA